MDRITGTGYALDGSGHRVFVDQNLAAGVDGTDVVAVWLTGVQEEPLAVIAAAGLAPDLADNTQLLQAITALIAGAANNAFDTAVAQIGPAILARRPFPPLVVAASRPGLTLGIGWYRFRLGGAGGGGGGGTVQAYGGCGGGAGGNEISGTFHVDAAGVFPFVCGAGGLGGLAAGNGSANGQPGGISTFLGLVAGGGAQGTSADDPGGGLGSGGVAGQDPQAGAVPTGISSLAFFGLPGSDGGDGTGVQGQAAHVAMGGSGGAGGIGGAGRGGAGQGIGAHGLGAGGGGAYLLATAATAPGGHGASGYLILETLAVVTGVDP